VTGEWNGQLTTRAGIETSRSIVKIDRDVAIPMEDGIDLRADVYRPDGEARVPAILTMGPYGKGLHYSEEHFAPLWKEMIGRHPEILEGRSSGDHMVWETVDPEVWAAAGYAIVRVDSRGAGRSPGVLDIWSPQETRDLYECIEWAGTRPWSTGRVGMCGMSYYAMNQWRAAALRPPHLAAIVPWEGGSDFYREESRQGGILSDARFVSEPGTRCWYDRQVLVLQHGCPGLAGSFSGESLTGPQKLSADELAANRVDHLAEMRLHPLNDEFYRSRSPDLSQIEVPLLSAAEWAQFDSHERGNFEGFTESGSAQKWLEVHSGRSQEWFYLPYGFELQKRFFDHFLKGAENGWEQEPRVRLQLRHTDRHFELRAENEWPLARTRWTKLYLDAADRGLSPTQPGQPASAEFEAAGEPLTFISGPLEEATEITGPMAARLQVASSTADADIFLTFRAFQADGTEVEFKRGVFPYTPLAKGCLRASHRKLDPARSKPWRPYHSHDEHQPLEPGKVYQLDIEIWPTCVVLPAGCRVALTVSGSDFEKPGTAADPGLGVARVSRKRHNDAHDRPKSVFGGRTQLHTGGDLDCYFLLPVIPART
jgi:uncharacterized protein